MPSRTSVRRQGGLLKVFYQESKQNVRGSDEDLAARNSGRLDLETCKGYPYTTIQALKTLRRQFFDNQSLTFKYKYGLRMRSLLRMAKRSRSGLM